MRNSKDFPQCRTNHEYFKNSFLPATIKEWNMLDSDIGSSETSKVLKFIRAIKQILPLTVLTLKELN